MKEIEDREILNIALRAGFSIFPVVGQLFNDFLDFQSKAKQERLNAFLISLGEYLTNNKDLTEEKLKDEDFNDFFESVLKRVVITKSEKKHEYFRQIVINQIEIGSFNIDHSETYLDLISNLSEMEIWFLKNHYEKDGLINSLGKQIHESSELIEKLSKMLPEELGLLNKGMANNYEIQSLELAKLKDNHAVILKKKEKLDEFKKETFYGITESQYVYYNQSLFSKGLLQDLGFGATFIAPFHIMKLTEFGRQFFAFLKQ